MEPFPEVSGGLSLESSRVPIYQCILYIQRTILWRMAGTCGARHRRKALDCQIHRLCFAEQNSKQDGQFLGRLVSRTRQHRHPDPGGDRFGKVGRKSAAPSDMSRQDKGLSADNTD